jgi:hypothetical protein
MVGPGFWREYVVKKQVPREMDSPLVDIQGYEVASMPENISAMISNFTTVNIRYTFTSNSYQNARNDQGRRVAYTGQSELQIWNVFLRWHDRCYDCAEISLPCNLGLIATLLGVTVCSSNPKPMNLENSYLR